MPNLPEDGRQYADELLNELASMNGDSKKAYLHQRWKNAREAGVSQLLFDITVFEGTMLQVFNQGENANPGVQIVSNVINSGGPVTGVAQGDGASVRANDITVFNQAVDSSDADATLKDALKQARLEIEGWNPRDPDERNAVLDQFDQFAKEAVKTTPNKHLLKSLWAGISGGVQSAAALTGVLRAGATVLSYFGIIPAP